MSKQLPKDLSMKPVISQEKRSVGSAALGRSAASLLSQTLAHTRLRAPGISRQEQGPKVRAIQRLPSSPGRPSGNDFNVKAMKLMRSRPH